MTYTKGEPVAEPEPVTIVKKKNQRNTVVLVNIPIVVIAILVFLLVFFM
ncbi:MAG: hypothetical protein ACW963_07605 [Candidatus Sifarchaeia archaeon]|jgi:hypothetical protein